MNIKETIYVCPKCKKEYTNHTLLSYWGGMADAAKDFMKNNKNATHCEDCGVRLVEKDNLEFYNENGDFDYKTNVVEFPQGKEFDFYINMIHELVRVKNCLGYNCVNFEGIVEKVKKENVDEEKVKNGIVNSSELVNHIKIKVNVDKEYVLYDLILGKVDYADIGDRYNSFMIEYYSKTLKTTIDFLSGAFKKDMKMKIKSSITADFDKKLLTYFC